MKKFNNKSGFTLIEIIVVLIIVGILAAIAIPNLFQNVNKSRSAEAMANIGSIRPNIEACISGHENAEGTCTLAYLFPAGVPTSPNFLYSFSTAPANGNTGYAVLAKGQGALQSTDTITITRAAAVTTAPLGGVTCAGGGTLAGAC